MIKIIPKEVIELNNLFTDNGKKIWIVGGAVRDFLKKETPKDFDIVTDCLPDDTIDIIKKSGNFILPVDGSVGNRFGVVIVKHKKFGDLIEVATLRKEIDKNRIGDINIELGASLKEDAFRRDLKINALYYDFQTDSIIDLVGGIECIENGSVEFVGNIKDRIKEDPLRILRFFRFSVTMNSIPTKNDLEVIRNNNKLEMLIDSEINRVSQEAIWVEFNKAWLKTNLFVDYLSFFDKTNMWSEVFPDICVDSKGLKETNFLVNTLCQLFRKHGMSKLSKFMTQQLKIDSNLSDQTEFLLSLIDFTDEDILKFINLKKRFHLSKEIIEEFFDVFSIDNKVLFTFLKFEKSVDSLEVIKRGFKGKEIGDEINRLEILNFRKLFVNNI